MMVVTEVEFMVQIEKTNFIGKGFHRECYRHPDDETLCIKIVVAGNAQESDREKRYYRHLEKRGVSWEMLPRYHGVVQTDQGPGSVFDLISDADGTVSQTLRHILSSAEKTAAIADDLEKSLAELKSYLLNQCVITMTLKSKNILCQTNGSGKLRLIIVDNIGNSDFIPICNYSKFLARKKILRTWKRFEQRMKGRYPENECLQRMLA